MYYLCITYWELHSLHHRPLALTSRLAWTSWTCRGGCPTKHLFPKLVNSHQDGVSGILLVPGRCSSVGRPFSRSAPSQEMDIRKKVMEHSLGPVLVAATKRRHSLHYGFKMIPCCAARSSFCACLSSGSNGRPENTRGCCLWWPDITATAAAASKMSSNADMTLGSTVARLDGQRVSTCCQHVNHMVTEYIVSVICLMCCCEGNYYNGVCISTGLL